MTETTSRLVLPLLQTAQAQKEITHNEALVLLDALVHASAESADLAAPPAAPTPGQTWLVAAPATGEWAGRADALAVFTTGGWRFIAPVEGLALWLADRALPAVYRDGAWVIGSLAATGLEIDGHQVIGARQGAIADPDGGTTVDAECRAALATLLAALRTHGLIET
ncbi:uncharacterized protein DUF2793 [Rhodothalassium salexigens DSM 2132]|uniref:Uncharacterized protein DUF2793 n=1 Tax=Rhodothalassium salexigens DSM 2132 TaxID=1188247 RepID=A0A4V2SPS6_RHOSA|nr:DUF2793 domain-containing protein [Rhodothalassium salexigens]MBB4211006.1 hypothetical protein [Rhodothalassium salexigens DSM 2132]MBK1639712.1 hypothetical protein [Rhodothalassium salexigens DSM 2132]TCP36336.1 uncharacterized protein DUF2793 [Rhodothalassium salexigens DSM 2132]